MERLGPNADIHAVRDAMARAADSTEDRMGQMTYDNCFTTGSCATRRCSDSAPTAGRSANIARSSAASATRCDARPRGERRPVLTDRMAYLLALPMVAARDRVVMNYAMTGQAPQDWRDALMPRTGRLDRNGNPQRLSLPTYIKDILSDWHDFPNTKKMLVSVRAQAESRGSASRPTSLTTRTFSHQGLQRG
jgi:hypothetical protein